MYSAKMPRRPSANDSRPRPAKTCHSVGKSPSPESPLSDNASDNSDLFQWATLDAPVATTLAPSFAAINASRKRKLLEQYFGNESRPGPLSTPPPPRAKSPHGPFRFAFSSHRSHSDSCQHSSTESLSSAHENSPLQVGSNAPVDKTMDLTWTPREVEEDEPSPRKSFPSPCKKEVLMPAPKSHRSPSRSSAWQANLLEDLDNNLAADFDGSLSGLGVDLSAASYNMSEALLALPSLTVFKQEIPSPSPSVQNDGRNGGQISPSSLIRRTSDTSAVGGPPTSFSHLLQSQHFWHHQNQNLSLENHPLTAGVGTGSASSLASSSSNEGNHMVTHTVFGNESAEATDEYRFQYILGAATSVATKINEENLAYLNQGQSYEIKLRRFGHDLHRGKLLKSVVRLCFHDRRLQYMEKEQIMSWRQANPGSRILEVDVPLSYGVTDVVQDQVSLNAATFTWNPAKEPGLYVKVHCISTEFTPKKHGGEKGVPFRIQVETFEADDPSARRIHAAACQIKVFKLKGGDRKHKQDREKLLKRPPSEQEKYQPQSNFTIFADIPLETLTAVSSFNGEQPAATTPSYPRTSSSELKPVFLIGDSGPPEALYKREELPDSGLLSADLYDLAAQPLHPEASSMQVTQWLQANRFGTYIATFNRFSGADLLRLNRDDLVQIVGVADGIRLFNVLHSKPIIPRLTIFVCVSPAHVYSALYMSTVTCSELNSKLSQLVQMNRAELKDMFLQGPGGIHILVTDEVVKNFKDESTYNVEIVKEPSDDGYSLLLKPSDF